MTRQDFEQLAIDNVKQLCFGSAVHPLKTRRGMVLGGGTVYPELNFTLPDIAVEAGTMPEVLSIYREIISGALRRAVELEVPGLVVEFETVPPMTEHPDWGMDVVRVLLDAMEDAWAKHQLKSVLRVTPNDNREFERPPVLRSGPWLAQMDELFERSAEAGAELLSIESVGGKELHDEALTYCDLPRVIFALCVLGTRDMQFLWSRIARIAQRHEVHAAGDSACGFGNTAMVLAEQKLIPRTFAAVVRVISAVRSLEAYACGAVGPGKDCAYENPVLKAITGFPMAMEGKSAACAHLSPLGNIAAAAADTWSNESVQHLKLLGGMAPTCCLESLVYDCRLMNAALGEGADEARMLQRWLVNSDAMLDPQAYVLTPANAIRFARVIVASPDPYAAGCAVAREAVAVLREGREQGLKVPDRELAYLDLMEQGLEMLPEDASQFIAEQSATVDPSVCRLEEYELEVVNA